MHSLGAFFAVIRVATELVKKAIYLILRSSLLERDTWSTKMKDYLCVRTHRQLRTFEYDTEQLMACFCTSCKRRHNTLNLFEYTYVDNLKSMPSNSSSIPSNPFLP